MVETVEILLSTYNGAQYLPEQLDSILEQDYKHWKLLIRDDGSNDDTVKMIEEYCQKYPEQITLLKDGEGNIGISASFRKLLNQSAANYVMFADQDDYWYPDKISTLLSVMLEKEVELPSTAHVVFSDLELADAGLNILSSSFLQKTGYSSSRGNQIFFLKNYVPGCNMMFNRNLIQQALKTENIIGLHDYWLMLIACCVGCITFVPKSLAKYRLHNNNAIGFMKSNITTMQKLSLFVKDNLKYAFSNSSYRILLYSKNIEQVQNICSHLSPLVTKEALSFASIDRSNYFSRKIKNITRPYLSEPSLLKRLTYIICF